MPLQRTRWLQRGVALAAAVVAFSGATRALAVTDLWTEDDDGDLPNTGYDYPNEEFLAPNPKDFGTLTPGTYSVTGTATSVSGDTDIDTFIFTVAPGQTLSGWSIDLGGRMFIRATDETGDSQNNFSNENAFNGSTNPQPTVDLLKKIGGATPGFTLGPGSYGLRLRNGEGGDVPVTYQVHIQVTPEPATAALLSAGLLLTLPRPRRNS